MSAPGMLGFPGDNSEEVVMIIVTERAAAELEEMLRVNNAAPGQGVKLVSVGIGTVGMTIDTPSEGDEVIRSGGEPLLIVDSRLAEDVDAVIDCDIQEVEGEPRAEFKIVPTRGNIGRDDLRNGQRG